MSNDEGRTTVAKQEQAVERAQTRVYVVLAATQGGEDGTEHGWKEVGRENARSDRKAIEAVIHQQLKDGEEQAPVYVAIPERSFDPVHPTVKTDPQVSFA